MHVFDWIHASGRSRLRSDCSLSAKSRHKIRATQQYAAAEFLKSNRIRITSCLIADVQMPNISGLALYGHLVASGAPIPTILITA